MPKADAAAVIMAVALWAGLGVQNAQGQTFKVLYTFTGGADGATPATSLIRDKAGNLYGTTEVVNNQSSGTVFKLSPSGVFTVLFAFPAGGGFSPSPSALTRDAAGNLYGTTAREPQYINGTVYKLDLKGNRTILHAFTGGNDGELPEARYFWTPPAAYVYRRGGRTVSLGRIDHRQQGPSLRYGFGWRSRLWHRLPCQVLMTESSVCERCPGYTNNGTAVRGGGSRVNEGIKRL